MEAFLSTLVQTTAALMAVLLAAIAAYFVFLQGKAAEFDDKLDDERSTIRSQIVKLQEQWPMFPSMFMPPEFKQRFSAHAGDVHGIDFIQKLSAAVIFPTPELHASLADVERLDTFGQAHLQGRLYGLALSESVDVISGGARLAFPQLGETELRLDPLAAFPRSPSESGFSQWRKDFDRLSGTLQMLEFQSGSAVQDFQAFISSQPILRNPSVIANLYATGVHAFFSSTHEIRAHLQRMDELELSRSRYSFSQRVHVKSLMVLISLCISVAVILPLFLMSGSVARLTAIVTNGVLVAALAFLVCSFLQFGWDVFQPLTPDVHLYVNDHWLRPILQEMTTAFGQLESYSPAMVERLAEWNRNKDSVQIPKSLADALANYASKAEVYNSSADRLDRAALAALDSDSALAPFRKAKESLRQIRSYTALESTYLSDPKRIEQIRKGLSGSREVVVSVESPFAWGSRTHEALVAAPRNREVLLDGLLQVSHKVSSGAESVDFHKAREAARNSLNNAKSTLEQFLSPSSSQQPQR